MAVKKEDIAYTSPSTAENQNESVKAYANEPIVALVNMAITSLLDNASFLLPVLKQ